MSESRTVLEIQALPAPEATNDKTFGVLLLVLLIVACGVGGALATTWWVGTHDLYPTLLPPLPDWNSYVTQVWGSRCDACTEDQMCYKADGGTLPAVYYLWDLCPQERLDKYPVAKRLEWPVARGERYRLAAYPLASSNLIQGLLRFLTVGTLSAQRGVFPGWMVSVYEPSKLYTDNPFVGTPTTPTSQSPLRCVPQSFSVFRWVEVLRACDRLPDASNVCDSGGQLLHHAPGSGVWYNLGNCLVRYNKLDALLFLMANAGCAYASTSTPPCPNPNRTISQDDKNKLNGVYSKLMLQTPDCTLERFSSDITTAWTEAQRQLTSVMTAVAGDADVFSQARKLLPLVKPNEAQVEDSCIFYREFHGHSAASAAEVLRNTAAILTGTVACAVAAAIALLFALLGRTSLLLPAATAAAAGGGAYFLWKVQLRKLLEGLGYVTLAGAIAQHGVTVEKALELVTDPSATDDADLVQAFSGMPATRIFDDAIQTLAVFLGYDCVVMHTQPNDSGCYSVEILDVTHHTLDSLINKQPWSGGLCTDAASPPCASDSYTYARGGLCWDSSFGQLVTPNQQSVYQRLGFETSSDPSIQTAPTAGDQAYATAVKKLFTNNNRAPCTCANQSSYRCLNCAGSASMTLCSVPK